jgi:hypothetical protein
MGTCSSIPAGQPAPSGQCTPNATCGNTGLCSGSGSCQQRAAGTVCGSELCSSNPTSSYTAAPTCNGVGGCVTPSANQCGAYVCKSGGCPTACSSDLDCFGQSYCGSNGKCTAQSVNSVPCTANDQCQSGFCANGFCCGSSCGLECQSCGVPGSEGTCTNVPAGGVDPTGTCTNAKADPSTCGDDGLCNGSGGCELYQPSTVCLNTCASDGSSLTPTYCDGGGNCNQAGLSTPCATNYCSLGPPPLCQ